MGSWTATALISNSFRPASVPRVDENLQHLDPTWGAGQGQATEEGSSVSLAFLLKTDGSQ